MARCQPPLGGPKCETGPEDQLPSSLPPLSVSEPSAQIQGLQRLPNGSLLFNACESSSLQKARKMGRREREREKNGEENKVRWVEASDEGEKGEM